MCIFTFRLKHLRRPIKIRLMHRPYRSQKRQAPRMDETVRIAANMQKSITSGRSSYVEMRAASRVFAYNVSQRVNSMTSRLINTRCSRLTSLFSDFFTGYEYTLTPNGILKRNDLEKLLSIDADIVLLLMSIDRILRCDAQADVDIDIDNLQELVNSRKRLIQIIRA
jgi:tRNA(His) 5'-end guanylyltransferase